MKRRQLNRWIVVSAAIVLLLAGCAGDSASGDRSAAAVDAEPGHAASMVSARLAMRDGNSPELVILQPRPGELVTSPVTIVVETSGISLARAGRVVDGEGHLHFMIDEPCVEPGTLMPKDATHVHVGSGSNVVALDLEPGPRQICAQIGDGFHTAVAIVAELDVVVAAFGSNSGAASGVGLAVDRDLDEAPASDDLHGHEHDHDCGHDEECPLAGGGEHAGHDE